MVLGVTMPSSVFLRIKTSKRYNTRFFQTLFNPTNIIGTI